MQLTGRIHRSNTPPIAGVLALAMFGDVGERLTVIGNGRHFFQFFGGKEFRNRTQGGRRNTKRARLEGVEMDEAEVLNAL